MFTKIFLFLSLFLVSGFARAADARPNVLFLFADDMKADTIAALGNPIIKTPNLDKLVHCGLSFQRAHMQGGLNGAKLRRVAPAEHRPRRHR